MSINDVRKEKMMTTQTKQPNSRYPQVCPTGGARKPRALDRQLVGCALYTNPPPFVLHQNHTEQVRFSYLSSDAKVQECPWFEDDRLFSDFTRAGYSDSRFLVDFEKSFIFDAKENVACLEV